MTNYAWHQFFAAALVVLIPIFLIRTIIAFNRRLNERAILNLGGLIVSLVFAIALQVVWEGWGN